MSSANNLGEKHPRPSLNSDGLYSTPVALICFSHLRWDFVFQRPQQLLTRFARLMQVIFIEEPVFTEEDTDRTVTKIHPDGVTMVVPYMRKRLSPGEQTSSLRLLIDKALHNVDIHSAIFWYYNPMAFSYSNHHSPALTVYDCMDELSAFKFAPPDITYYEELLMQRAQIVFTGGRSLFSAKNDKHANVYLFPSSIDKDHFGSARGGQVCPSDQADIPGPRLGFFGVIDERFDLTLIEQVAIARPEWHFVLIGPIVKIDPDTLPQADNIHYLGSKPYKELPAYIAGWDIALIPFQLNESTRFISPTKTPEYLAAGVPVISTPITDVINPYGINGLVKIVGNAGEFVNEASTLLSTGGSKDWLARVDAFLTSDSWDNTCKQMMSIITTAITIHSSTDKTRLHV